MRTVDGTEVRTFEGPFVVDTHVHVHPCFALDRLLDSAEKNFRLYGAAWGAGDARSDERSISGLLVLTEGATERTFQALRDGRPPGRSGQWSFAPTGDEISVLATKGDARILIVGGRQIVARERLEVLLLGSTMRFPDGRSFRETLEEAANGPGIAAVPWGFGKWWARRGRLLRESLSAIDPARVFVADNGGRPRGLPKPALMRWALARGHRLLAGSDPLPLPWQVERAGRYGSVLDGTIPEATPGVGILDLIRCQSGAREFGRRDSLLRCVRAQIGIRRSSPAGRIPSL